MKKLKDKINAEILKLTAELRRNPPRTQWHIISEIMWLNKALKLIEELWK